MRTAAPLVFTLATLSTAASAEPRVAVMSAFAPEWGVLRDTVEGAEAEVINGVTFVTGSLAGREVVLFLSGISMVNAAMTTQLALDHFDVDAIVFSGIAGGVDPELHIGDVVVASEWSQYLESLFARQTSNGFAVPPWMSSELPNFGMMFPQPVNVIRDGLEQPRAITWFETDPDLLALAEAVAGEIELADCNSEGVCLSETPGVVVGGHGVSGQAFVDNADFRGYVFETFEARVLDMESAAVAHVAWANEVPFIAFRSLSDLAGGGEGENEMETFFSLAGANSAAVVMAFLDAMD